MKRYFIKGTNQEVKISDGLSEEGLGVLLDMGAVVEVNVESSSDKQPIEFGDNIDELSEKILVALNGLQESLRTKVDSLNSRIGRLENYLYRDKNHSADCYKITCDGSDFLSRFF